MQLWAAAPAGIKCPEGLEGVLFGDGDDVDDLPWLIFSVVFFALQCSDAIYIYIYPMVNKHRP